MAKLLAKVEELFLTNYIITKTLHEYSLRTFILFKEKYYNIMLSMLLIIVQIGKNWKKLKDTEMLKYKKGKE